MNDIKDPVRLKWLVVSGRPGEPMQFSENIVSDTFELEYGSYKGSIKKGKRWLTVSVSPSRIGQADFSVFNGKIEGAIWCLADDKDEAREKLAQAARSVLEAEIDRLQASIDSLDAARTPSIR